jgi:hypothetical protein
MVAVKGPTYLSIVGALFYSSNYVGRKIFVPAWTQLSAIEHSDILSNDLRVTVKTLADLAALQNSRLKLIAQPESLRKLLLVVIKVDQVRVIGGIFLMSSAHREMCPSDDS